MTMLENRKEAVGSWRGCNFSRKGLRAAFTAADGEITATVMQTGAMLIVR